MSHRVGVLALQGAVGPHVRAIDAAGGSATLVRTPDQIERVDSLILPGGESTTIGMLAERFGLMEPIRRFAGAGRPILGTCAGMILLAKDIVGSEQARIGVMDIHVRRNSFGRQVDSFEVPLSIPALGGDPFPGVFIRAPHIESAEPCVEVLARFGDRIVFARQGNLLAASFHPELTSDHRVHQLLLSIS